MSGGLFDLTGKRAFITGGTKGIGRAIAEAFVDHGAIITLTSRAGEDAQAVAAAISQRAGRAVAHGVAASMADRQSLISAFDAAVSLMGQVDVLVCNAAAQPAGFGGASQADAEEYTRLLQWNVVNNAALMNHAAGPMKQRRDGVILATSSASGVRPIHTAIPYGVSKAGLNHFVRTLGGELAPYNVRVNAIAPGLTLTESVKAHAEKNPDMVKVMRARVPLRRMLDPREIAAGMVFLASEGGKAITGQTISMDGGEPGPGVGPGPED